MAAQTTVFEIPAGTRLRERRLIAAYAIAAIILAFLLCVSLFFMFTTPVEERSLGKALPGILGGAVVPLAVGALGDAIGLRAAMSIVFLTLAYLLGISAWARPLVRNETTTLTQLLFPTKPRPGT